MTTYFSTFITGLREVVQTAIIKRIPDIKIIKVLDGLVIYQTNIKPDEIKKIRFLNNSFVLLKLVNGSLEQLLKQLLIEKNLSREVSNYLPAKRISFRVMTWEENKSAAVNNQTLLSLERKIANDKLFVNRSRPHLEFGALSRSEGISLFGLRVSGSKDMNNKSQPGQLRPELANILCSLSQPAKDDVFLDPFSGYGSVPLERAKYFPYKKVIAGDINPDLVEKLKSHSKQLGKYFQIVLIDGADMKDIASGSIDRIVTDPPWGEYSEIDVGQLYSRMVTEFNRVLKTDGIVVVLVADREFPRHYLQNSGLALEDSYNILVSGNKATIFKLRKT